MDYVWLVPFLPLLGFLINGIGFKAIPGKIAGFIASGAVFASLIVTIFAFSAFTGGDGTEVYVNYFTWLKAGNLQVPFSFLIDQLSLQMMLIITGVGFLIHLYSIGYMKGDAGAAKYFSFLNLFIFSMLLLVMGSNYILLFAGWEGVGFCSYLLIGFWYTDKAKANAAQKAFVMNRIGDMGFLIGLFIMFITFGSLNFANVFAGAANFVSGDATIVAITLCLFIGAIGKSAQIPLFTWLPDAMAGPTPVSALIHAATMVTAGIYMVARSSVLYALAPFTLHVILIIGIATALLAAIIAMRQNDIKKVLAYSTVSQLGYMFIAIGLGAFGVAMFHVTTHAFFKALLFLGAGSVIHAMQDEQNMQKMGGLKKHLPITFITFLIATLSIAGFPFTAGFFSKDAILSLTLRHSIWLSVLFGITYLLTAAYMFRALYLTFYGKFRGTKSQLSHLHESPFIMTIPLIILAVFAAFGGILNLPELFGGHHAMSHWLSYAVQNAVSLANFAHPHSVEWLLLAVALLVIVLTILWVHKTYKSYKPADQKQENWLFKIVSNKFYIDEIYNAIISRPLQWAAKAFYGYIEKSLDSIVNAVGAGIDGSAKSLRKIQTGQVGFYLFVMVLSISVLLLIYIIRF